MAKSIKHQFTFPQPPGVVWDYLTNSELLAEWLMPNDLKPVVGYKFQFKSKAMPRFGFDGIIHCEVLEILPEQKLVYSWRGGSLDSVVVWTLTAANNGTVLTLEHKGFRSIKNFLPFIIMNSGWLKIGKRLLTKLNHL